MAKYYRNKENIVFDTIVHLIVLLALGQFTLFHLTMLRAATDLLMFLHRLWYCRKYRNEFAN